MLGIITFIIVFGILVIVHEFGHLYFAKKAGILVREFSIGMGPKIFSHFDKEGTAYTFRILPLGGYVRMAGWGDDTTEIKSQFLNGEIDDEDQCCNQAECLQGICPDDCLYTAFMGVYPY